MIANITNNWLFQCNPNKYDVNTYLTENNDYIYWKVGQKKNDIKIGDAVFFGEGDYREGLSPMEL